MFTTTPVFFGAIINSGDEATCSITIKPTPTGGSEAEILWHLAETDTLVARLTAEGVEEKSIAIQPYDNSFTLSFRSSLSVPELVDELDRAMEDLCDDGWMLNWPNYWYQMPGDTQPTLAISVEDWYDQTRSLTITEEWPTLDSDGWQQFSERLVNPNHEAGKFLVSAGLKFAELNDQELSVTIPVGANLLAAMENIAKCHPSLN